MNCEEIYNQRINRAIDFISENLESNLTIEEISREAGFSTYHFHRIFRAFTGESLYAFVSRLRVEKAASLFLTATGTITETAFQVGFNDGAVFARAFKKRFGCSASQWRKGKSRNHQAEESPEAYTTISREGGTPLLPDRVYIRDMPERHLLYLRDFGPFAGDYRKILRLHRRLLEILQTRQILWCRQEGYFLVFHDSMGITANEKLRISYGVLTDQEVPENLPLGALKIPGHTCLMTQFTLDNREYGMAWTEVFRRILPAEGLEAADGPCFENYREDCYNGTTGKTEVTIGIPVKPLGRRI